MAPAKAGAKDVSVGTIIEARTESNQQVTLRIDQIEIDPQDKTQSLTLYSVSAWDDSIQKWQPFCAPDKDGQSKAIALSGTWDAQGKHHPSKKIFTFACTSGVLAKCVRWGYKPWDSHEGKSLDPYHQTCTRLARADYCGDGTPHTRDGTLIDVYDRLGIQKQGNLNMPFEAAWGPKGATYIRKARWFETLDELETECPKLKKHIDRSPYGLSQEQILKKWPQTLMFNDSLKRTHQKKY